MLFPSIEVICRSTVVTRSLVILVIRISCCFSIMSSCTVHGCSYNIADPWVFASISSCPIRENKDSNISDMSKPTKGCFVQVWRPHELIHVDLSNEEELKKYMDLYEK